MPEHQYVQLDISKLKGETGKMKLAQFTPLPNEIPDSDLEKLTLAELKVLIVILRQTLGWRQPGTERRKCKDWISIRFFQRKTGLGARSISYAIASLVTRGLVIAFSTDGHILRTPQDRKGKRKILYAYAPYYFALQKEAMVNKFTNYRRY